MPLEKPDEQPTEQRAAKGPLQEALERFQAVEKEHAAALGRSKKMLEELERAALAPAKPKTSQRVKTFGEYEEEERKREQQQREKNFLGLYPEGHVVPEKYKERKTGKKP